MSSEEIALITISGLLGFLCMIILIVKVCKKHTAAPVPEPADTNNDVETGNVANNCEAVVENPIDLSILIHVLLSIKMRVQTEEWQRFIPGMRMYRGKMTYFYNGEILVNNNGENLIYSEEERKSWKVIIVLPGVEDIHELTFCDCYNVETVIMADTVKRIEEYAFYRCISLVYVKLSRTLEYIGLEAFQECKSLPSIFIPLTCREIVSGAFEFCEKLMIFVVSADTVLRDQVIASTALIYASPFETNENGEYVDTSQFEINEDGEYVDSGLGLTEVNQWIKNINGDTDEYALHRACASYNPIIDIIYEIVTSQGPKAFHTKNEIGITPLQYLVANPFAENVDQKALMKRYVLEMIGEVV